MKVGGCAHVGLVAMGRSPFKHPIEVDTDHPTVSLSAHVLALLAIYMAIARLEVKCRGIVEVKF